jgi:5-hydroxyisourate hydrolase-like protein (transthyretin family)
MNTLSGDPCDVGAQFIAPKRVDHTARATGAIHCTPTFRWVRPTGAIHCAPTSPNRHLYLFLAAFFIACVLVFSAHPFTAAYAAAGPGRISGQLLDGTKNNAPVAGQSVTLQMAQGDTASDLTTVKTDAQGRYIFSNLNADKTINYAVYTLYHGAQYVTDLIDLSTRPVQQVNLTVYDATTSTANIVIVQATILIHKPDAQKDVFTVSELFAFKNLGTTTYVGSLNASAGMPNALRFSLPRGARNVSLSKGFDGYRSIAVDQGFATEAAVPPGDSEFSFSFDVPYTTSSYDFSYTVVYPTVQLSLLVPPVLHANSAALASQGLTSSGQDPYQLLQARELGAGVEVHAQLEGLPVTARATNTSALSPAQLWLIAGVLAILALLCATWFVFLRNKGQKSGRIPGRDKVSAKGKIPAGGTFTEAQGKERQQELLQELLALDKAFEAGKLKQTEYEEQRARTKALLRTLMSADSSRKTTRSGSKRTS